jgi:hypothetical protein
MTSGYPHYLCPFCYSSWNCEGPHIEQKDLESFYKRISYISDDLSQLAKETVDEYAKQNNIDLKELGEILYQKIKNREVI